MKTIAKGRMFLHVLLWRRAQSTPFKLWGEINRSTEPLLRTAAALSRSRCYKVYRNQNIIFLFPLHSSKHLVNKLWSHPRNLVCGRNDRIFWSNGARKVVAEGVWVGGGGFRRGGRWDWRCLSGLDSCLPVWFLWMGPSLWAPLLADPPGPISHV